MSKDLNDLRRERSEAATALSEAANALNALPDEASDDDVTTAQAAFDTAQSAFDKLDQQVTRREQADAALARAAKAGDDGAQSGSAGGGAAPRPAVAADKPADMQAQLGYTVAALAQSKGDLERAVRYLDAEGQSGISASLSGATDGAGGVTIPRPMAEGLIGLLRPRVVVRRAGARSVPMPAGQLRNAKMTGGATAGYGAELDATAVSAQTFDKIDMDFKKLTALVPVSNTLLRQSGVNMALEAGRDLIEQSAAREDIAFLRGDGSANTPTGLESWCPAGHVLSADGTAGATDATVIAQAEARVRKAASLVEDANVAMSAPVWIMRASAKNWLASLRNPDSGQLVFPSIDINGTLRGFPIETTSQIPDNLGAGAETRIIFADMAAIMVGDAYTTTLAQSTEAAYVDGSGNTQSAFQRDQTLMRAVSEHDLAPEHDVAISVIEAIAWTL